MRRIPLRPAAFAFLAVALVATACGTSGPAGSTVVPDTLVIGISRQLTTLDPGNGGSVDGDGTIQRAIYSGLTYYDPKLELKGDLATSWEQTSATAWTFHLRPGVTFSDGTPLTSADVKWNFDRFLDPDTKLRSASTVRAFVASVQAPDPTTVVVNTKGPYLDLPDRTANFLILNREFTLAHEGQNVTLGSGPYQLETVDLDNGATLVANPKYYGDKPTWQRVTYKVLQTEAQRVQAAQAGEIDVAIQYEPASLKLFASSARYATGIQWSSWNNTLRINERVKPLDDVRVRQAINYAIDKKNIIDNVIGADIQPLAGQVISAPYDKVNPDLAAYPYDPDKARKLLADAGYGSGFELELALTQGSYVAQDPASQVIAKNLEAVGIKVKITQAAFANWVQRTYSNEAPALYFIGYTSGYKAPAERLRIYATANPQTHYSPDDTAYDALVAKVSQAKDVAEQQRYVNEATAHFREQAHVIFLWPQPLTYVVNKNLTWTPRPEHWLVPQEFTPKR